MHTILDPAQAGSTAPTRMLLLPAAYAGPADFLQAGFVSAVRQRSLPVDLVLAELNLLHLTDRTMLRRLRHELVLPARALGSASIWLCGISLGGFIGMTYAERYPGEIDGLCLLAPYLGNHIVTGEIQRANGVASWQPGELAEDDDERRVWRFIKFHERHAIRMHLGFGREDRFADSQQMMAAALSPACVQVVPGGHDWSVWTRLWVDFLDTCFVRPDMRVQSDASATRT